MTPGPGDKGHPSQRAPALIDIEMISTPFALLEAERNGDGVIVDFLYRAVNEAAVRDYGLPRDHILATSMLDLAPLTGDSVLFDRLVDVVETGESVVMPDYEYAHAPPLGKPLFYDITVSRIRDGVGLAWNDVTSRYEHEREVARAERETRAIVSSLLDPLHVFEPVRDGRGAIVDLRLLRTNEAGCRYLRRQRAEIEGGLISQWSKGEAGEVLFAWCRHVAVTGDPVVLDEMPLTLPSGHRRIFDVRAVPVENLISVTYRDVTDRVRAATQITQAKERYRLVAENSSEMVFQSGSGGIIEWVSPSVQWVLGWRREDVLGRRVSDFVHPEDLATAISEQKAMIASGRREGRVEVRMVNSDGQYRWMSIIGKAIMDARGRVIGGVDAVRDIQDSRDAQQALSESEERFRRSMDDSAIGMAVVAPDGTYLRVNQAMCSILGRTREDLLACSWQDLTYPEDLEIDTALVAQIVAGQRDAYRLPKRYVKPDGEIVWAELSVSCLRDKDGAVVSYLSQMLDITESVKAQEALTSSEEHYRLIAENSLDVVFRATVGGRLLWISPSVTEVLGWRPDEVIGKPMMDFLLPGDVEPGLVDPRSPQRIEFEGRVRQADGSHRWIDIISRPVLDDQGVVVSRVGRLRDIAAKKEAEEALRRSEQRFRTAMESAPTGMAVVSLDRRFLEVNPALSRLLGHSEEWLLQHGIPDVLDPQDDSVDRQLRDDLLTGEGHSVTSDHQMIRADGHRITVEHSMGLLFGESGQPSGFVSQFIDVTDARKARDQLRFLATHDSLTELLNRRELVARVAGILGHPPRTGENVGIMFIDIDHLKPINDTFGHAVGDEVIVTTARKIREVVRSSDVVARFGGDEFVVVLPAVHTVQDVERIAQMLHDAVRQPIIVGSVQLSTTMSVGAVVVAPGHDPEEALRRADEALYSAKRSGRDQTVIVSD